MIGSTAAIDRDGEVLEPKGFDLKNFKKNPVILQQHQYYLPPVAKAESVKVKDGKLVFKIKFPPEGVYDMADVYRRLYKEGFMHASSVGFIPVKWEDGDGKTSPYRRFTKTELLELSLVSVPCNPEALVGAKGVSPEMVKAAAEAGVKDQEAFDEFMKSIDEDSEPDNKENTSDNEKEALKAEIIEEIKEALPEMIAAVVDKAINQKNSIDKYSKILFDSASAGAPESETDKENEEHHEDDIIDYRALAREAVSEVNNEKM
jgi:HK97 family phage prohead protease